MYYEPRILDKLKFFTLAVECKRENESNQNVEHSGCSLLQKKSLLRYIMIQCLVRVIKQLPVQY